jgi:hypothetical protein
MEQSRAGLGCTISLVVLIIGVVVGASAMAAFLGVGFGDLVARANGQVAPVLREVTPTPATQIIGGAAPGRRLVWRAPIPLDSDTREPELLVISRNHERQSDTLMLLSPDDGAIRWESAPLGDNGSSWVVVYSADAVIIADESRLIGVSRADGATLWEAPLTDKIFYNVCVDCLQVFGDVVVALADDGQLQAFSAARGAPLWSVRLNQAVRQLVRVGDLVGVPDSLTKDDSEAGLSLYSPADGALVRTIEPSCEGEGASYEDRPHYYDRVLSDSSSGSLYWMLDSAYCLLRVGTGQFGGEQRSFDESFRSFDEHNALAADGAIYLSTGDALLVVDAQGDARLLLRDEDYTMQPLEVGSGAVLVLAQRTRGSSRLELWLIDSATGQRGWAHVLVASDPLHGPYDSGDFAAHIVGSSVALFEQLDEPESVRFELISFADGASTVSAQVQVADAGGYIRGIAWGNKTAWLAMDELYAVSLESGATVSRWP